MVLAHIEQIKIVAKMTSAIKYLILNNFFNIKFLTKNLKFFSPFYMQKNIDFLM